ncbi:MAG: xanthine dehydrogenase family protein molybdopterin-binding subunit, partial [Chloroflexi bacterium]|nr:xanthine dehydrogenase family protein molybdopterin-binding subunit [Chloroflexota bacterium]
RHGVGIALSLYGAPGTSAESSGAIIKLNEDGSFDVFANANDGNSGSATVLAQIAAEVLGVPMEDILMHTSDTASIPFDAATSASATLYGSGGAVKKAAEQIRRQILTVAGRMLNTLPEALKINAGTITAPNGHTTTISQVASHSLHIEGRHIMTTASWKVQQTPTSFAAQGVEVEVDTETGSVRVVKAITAVDAGRVINPLIVGAQLLGSAVQGLGAGICEEMIYDRNGHLLTTTFSDYGIYNARDMPEMQTYMVETNDPANSFGAKVVAEHPLNAMAPAIANAVADALGVRIRQIPFTPERVLRALHAQANKH